MSVSLQEGDVLAGKYRIERVLGVGGMGAVVAARHLQLDERVAIKFVLPEALGSAEAIARFAREARAAFRIKNDHVARVIDVSTLENGAPYMVMEYLEGSDLAQTVRQRGALSFEDAVEYVLQVCEAMADAHALGIIHRDLKPANLFLTRRSDGTPWVKVLDFGISKVTGLAGSGPDMGMTKTTAVMGSPLYMSPEQMASAKDVDVRTDIWSLGAILYELVTGVTPFMADSLPQLCTMILTQHPPPLRNVRPDAPAGFEDVVLKCMQKDRAARYANVAELAVALQSYGPRRSRASVERVTGILRAAGMTAAQSTEPPSSAETVAAATTSGLASWGQTVSESQPKNRALRIGGLAVLLVALGGAAAAALFFRQAPPKDSFVAELASASTGAPSATPAISAAAPPNETIRVPTTPTAATSSSAERQVAASPPPSASIAKPQSGATAHPPVRTSVPRTVASAKVPPTVPKPPETPAAVPGDYGDRK